MEFIDLNGTWTLLNHTTDKTVPGHLPGCNYLDLMAAGAIVDPFWGQNEADGTKVAADDYTYSRTFDLEADVLRQAHVELVLAGVDTLAAITLNGQEVARTDNCHRTYRFDVKSLLHEGSNNLAICFTSPYAYIAERQKNNPMGGVGGAVKGVSHLRKVQCHFGWDWGPNLPPVGVTGKVGIAAYENRFEDVTLSQQHAGGKVTLSVTAQFPAPCSGQTLQCVLSDPDGKPVTAKAAVDGDSARLEFVIDSPQLWWCNGLGAQPLYHLSLQLLGDGKVLDEAEKQIGLRTIELDTRTDEIGRQFRFILNGVPVFAKGADWIPSDSFVNRTTYEDLRFYIEQAKWANMNMLRIWGGGYYESDDFYELCDQNGILVWQDFAFACSAYPFEEAAFLENVHQEVIDNVRRLRHHASLALWCGNNENELMLGMWKKNKLNYEANYDFYYNRLKGWVNDLDAATPYWYGSPSSGQREVNAIELNDGDSHLWGVWHGLLPVTSFRRMPARFTSEFGVESFPSMRAIRSFTDKPDIDYLDPVMLTHQKSAGGNQKILFYLIDNYRNPKNFADFVYLSQLTQAQAMRFATDEWRRKMGRCNGSIYWQYNDCWPVASWAGIDYLKQPKAVHYHARQFNKPVCLSNDLYADRAEIYLANDLNAPLNGTLHWQVADFSGALVSQGEQPVAVPPVTSQKLCGLAFESILHGKDRSQLTLTVTLSSTEGLVDEKTWLLVADKFARLPRAAVQASCRVKGDTAFVTLHSDVFVRSLYAEVDGVLAPLSDNFFDLLPGQEKTITFPAPQDKSEAELHQALHLRSLADVEPKSSLFGDKLKQFSLRFTPINFITWLLFKFVTKLEE